MIARSSMTARRSASSSSVLLLLQVLLTFFASIIAVSSQAALEPARVSCNAAYSAPCARTNAEYLATTIAASQIGNGDGFFADINSGVFNRDTGFYPFVFEKETSKCAAHGANRPLVGMTLEQIFDFLNIGFSDAPALHSRFVDAASRGGDWVQYLWSDGGSTNSKLAFVTSFTSPILSAYYIGVGYEDIQLPPDLPCSQDFDSFCSITNVRSLLGKAQFRLLQAESLEAFEAAVFDLSFDSENFQIPQGFYTFMYHYDGRLKSHALLHDSFGVTLSQIIVNKRIGDTDYGLALHQAFMRAADGENNGWVQYPWKNDDSETLYTKIASIVKIVFETDEYYLGVGYTFAMDSEGLSEGPTPNEACSADYNLPCAFRSTRALSSHTLSHAISSPRSVNDMFSLISSAASFRQGPLYAFPTFYAFAYDFNGTCVAHGAQPDYVGLQLTDVFELNNIPLDANLLHETFRAAAKKGGGWVLYDWLVPYVANSEFEKISYIFQMNIQGASYYGGVGFNHKRYPVVTDADYGLTKNQQPIPCSQKYGLQCSETNTQAILGQALVDLTLAASKSIVTADEDHEINLQFVLYDITDQLKTEYAVNDFFVSVFSTEGGSEPCFLQEDDGSGCCVAHGADPTNVGRSWSEILEKEQITSIQGFDLHNRLILESNTGSSWLEYPWSSVFGEARTKRSWVARFRTNEGTSYYVVAEYLKTPLPATCDQCPQDQECTSGNQAFCTDKPDKPDKPDPPLREHPVVISLIVIFCLGLPLVIFIFWWRKRQSKERSRQKLKELDDEMQKMATQMEQQMQGMVEVVHDMPIRTPEKYVEQVEKQLGVAIEECAAIAESTTVISTVAGVWHWEEDASYLDRHEPSIVLTDTNFVRYAQDISATIERAYLQWQEGRGFAEYHLDLSTSTTTGQKVNNADTGLHYDLDFVYMVQKNVRSGFQRNIHREEVEIEIEKIDSEVLGGLPRLPDDVDFSDDAEDLLPTFSGQVIQVSKVHPNKLWLYGNVLYDPLIKDAQQQPQASNSAGLNSVLASALHDRPTSGWFPKSVTEPADVNVMQKLLKDLGGEGSEALKPPFWWEEAKEGNLQVPKGSKEYDEVANYFMAALYNQRDLITVTNVERVQNLPLWQSYAVKRQTMKTRDTKNEDHYRVNNKSGNAERKWLFHGSTSEVIPKIENQGFNRAFAGRNAVAFGKGVYFARDASYSSHTVYSEPDKNGIQRMFMCRVSVGDWCKGTNEQLTPDPKPHNSFELFDSTVDNVANPSVFVVYHDAQAYPGTFVTGTTCFVSIMPPFSNQ